MAMKNNDFVAFILTYGRADRVFTYESLRKRGYTGEVRFICSTDDPTVEEYKKKFGSDKVFVFDKWELMEDETWGFDPCDNFKKGKKDGVIIFARNYCFKLANELGFRNFIQLDDDYVDFVYRWRTDKKLAAKPIKDLDAIFDLFVDFMTVTPTKSIAFAQAGDFLGGKDNIMFKKGYIGRKRKAMNSFFCRTDRAFKFIGRINEDVNTYTQTAKLGNIFLTHPLATLNQKTTQTNKGGMTETYLDSGTYIKSFYTVMLNPSAVTVKMMGNSNRRLHHSVRWENMVPVIINEKWKRGYE